MNLSRASKPPPLFFSAGRLGVTRPRFDQPEAEFTQPAPAGLRAGRNAPTGTDIGGDLGSGPQPAIGRFLLQGVEEFALLLGRQLALALVESAAVGQPL